MILSSSEATARAHTFFSNIGASFIPHPEIFSFLKTVDSAQKSIILFALLVVRIFLSPKYISKLSYAFVLNSGESYIIHLMKISKGVCLSIMKWIYENTCSANLKKLSEYSKLSLPYYRFIIRALLSKGLRMPLIYLLRRAMTDRSVILPYHSLTKFNSDSTEIKMSFSTLNCLLFIN